MGAVVFGVGMCDKGCPSALEPTLGVCPVLGSAAPAPPLGSWEGRLEDPWGGSRERCPQEAHSQQQIRVTGSALHTQGHQGPGKGTPGFHPSVPVQKQLGPPDAFPGWDRQRESMENHGQKGRRRHSTENLCILWPHRCARNGFVQLL